MASRNRFVLSALAGAFLLSGCAMHRGGMGMSRAGEQHQAGQHMSMGEMCAMHRQMTAGKSPAQQRAAIEEHIKSMHGSVSPDMVVHHEKMMEMHCGAPAAGTSRGN